MDQRIYDILTIRPFEVAVQPDAVVKV